MAERFIETGVEIRGCPETCRIVREVDSSVVLVNASTRFNDGDELGLGAEIGISTSNCMPSAPWG